MKAATFSKLFDHSILRPDATRADLVRFAETAARLKTATLTVQPCNIQPAASVLRGSGVLVGAVIGFPHGCETASMKEFQTQEALTLGAEEIDMVMNIAALKDRNQGAFMKDVEGVVRAAKGALVKVILENCFLNEEEKRRACEWIAQTGAHFVKTSTGYAAGGATVEDVRLMRETVAGKCQVKAAGGIRSMDDVLAMLRAGATRLGSTRSDQFVQAYWEMPEDKKKDFAEFLVPVSS